MDSSNVNGNPSDSNKLTVTTAQNSNPTTIADTLAVKDRSKNGSEPVGGLSKGHLNIQDIKVNNDTA